MTQTVIVDSKDLHIECMSPLLYLKRCFKCHRYRRCNYSFKVIDEEYEELQTKRRNLMEQVKAIDAKIKTLCVRK